MFIGSNYTFGEDPSQLLAWLSPLEPRLQHRDIEERRVANVQKWLMKTEECRIWCGSGREREDCHTVLFCHGDLGVGKIFIR